MFLLAGVIGCTPFSERLMKKGDIETGNEVSLNSGESEASFDYTPCLDQESSRIVRSYGSTIKRQALKYGFDWRLILAVMKQESRFLPYAESHKGASGFMQIMPNTSAEVARVLHIEDMTRPQNNIRGGTYYLGRLYNLFEGAEESNRIKLTLASYNAGVGRVYDAQELAAYFDENPTTWHAVRDALPLLSKRFYTLHENVWSQDKPKSGWFGNATETVNYVEKVMSYYEEYKAVLN